MNEAVKNLEVFLNFMERREGGKVSTKREIFMLLEKHKSIVFVAEEKKMYCDCLFNIFSANLRWCKRE